MMPFRFFLFLPWVNCHNRIRKHVTKFKTLHPLTCERSLLLPDSRNSSTCCDFEDTKHQLGRLQTHALNTYLLTDQILRRTNAENIHSYLVNIIFKLLAETNIRQQSSKKTLKSSVLKNEVDSPEKSSR